MKVFIVELEAKTRRELSLNQKIEVKDDVAYQIAIEVDRFEEEISSPPKLSIGDISLPLVETQNSLGSTIYKTEDRGSFYDKAIFLNYFGECELTLSFEEMLYSYLFDVNVNSHKAQTAKDIVSYLSKNSEDILQSCYSKSKTGYSHKDGSINKIVKLKALESAIYHLESIIPKLRFGKKHDIEPKVEFHSSRPPSFSDRVNEWLFENVDEIEVSNSNDYSFRLNNYFMKVELPNSVNEVNTNQNENHVIHYFVKVAQQYLKTELTTFRENFLSNTQLNSEYEGYIKFDKVIKHSLQHIYDNKEKVITRLLSRLNLIQKQLNKYIPIKKLKPIMPVQTSFTLRHKHYSSSFEAIRTFYQAKSANKQQSSFLLGLRNLSQLFEFACLYYLVNYLKQSAKLTKVDWLLDSPRFKGPSKKEVNVLGNCFEFENETTEYTLLYEKKFYSVKKATQFEQLDNLIRVDRGASYFEPDFTIRVKNKITDDYFYVILDAKFSRQYKMFDKLKNENIGVLSSVYLKYGNNLKALSSSGVENLTKFVGVMFGLKTKTDKTNRVTYFDPQFDINGELPITPFSSADFINFSTDLSSYSKVLDMYLKVDN